MIITKTKKELHWNPTVIMKKKTFAYKLSIFAIQCLKQYDHKGFSMDYFAVNGVLGPDHMSQAGVSLPGAWHIC